MKNRGTFDRDLRYRFWLMVWKWLKWRLVWMIGVGCDQHDQPDNGPNQAAWSVLSTRLKGIAQFS